MLTAPSGPPLRLLLLAAVPLLLLLEAVPLLPLLAAVPLFPFEDDDGAPKDLCIMNCTAPSTKSAVMLASIPLCVIAEKKAAVMRCAYAEGTGLGF